jgi:hypothetical protein
MDLAEDPLLLVGYRLVPVWVPPEAMADPLLPSQVVTISDHLVDAVPDDDTWFDSLSAANDALARSAASGSAQVLAMGLHRSDAGIAIAARLTLDTVQLCLNEHAEMAFPTTGEFLGYELIGIESCGFHSWLCYGDVAPWAYETLGIRVNAQGLITSLSDARRLSTAAQSPRSDLPPIPWAPAAIAACPESPGGVSSHDLAAC